MEFFRLDLIVDAYKKKCNIYLLFKALKVFPKIFADALVAYLLKGLLKANKRIFFLCIDLSPISF